MNEELAQGWLRAQATPTNLIVLRLYSKAHSEAQSHTVIKEIVEHHNGGHAIATHCYSIIRRHEPARAGMHQPTRRWEEMLAGPGDGSTKWMLVIDLKDSIALAPGRVRSIQKIEEHTIYAVGDSAKQDDAPLHQHSTEV